MQDSPVPKNKLKLNLGFNSKHHLHKPFSDDDKIRHYLLLHPYFKNPNHYHIRLVTIMKYLKRKGLDLKVEDIDLIVENVILNMPNVKKVSEEKYSYKK